MSSAPNAVALIPARSGSKRVPGKNVRQLGAHPVIAYSIASALESGVFGDVVVSTDDEEYAAIARHYGAKVPALRPASMAGDASPDIDWVEHTLRMLKNTGHAFDCFSLLRPTNPFRQPSTIRRAWTAFTAEKDVDSLRAVERCRQHPGKMWVVHGKRMMPLLSPETVRLKPDTTGSQTVRLKPDTTGLQTVRLKPDTPNSKQPWHSSQTNTLPEVFVQNASLEIAWTRVVTEGRTIAGEIVMPFFTEGFEGFDVNTGEDWILAEHFVNTGEATLPDVAAAPYRAA